MHTTHSLGRQLSIHRTNIKDLSPDKRGIDAHAVIGASYLCTAMVTYNYLPFSACRRNTDALFQRWVSVLPGREGNLLTGFIWVAKSMTIAWGSKSDLILPILY